ncbi:hypothetical protein J3D54_004751 [Pseudomonas sp. GGS8]|uniref:AprI/Inh family metalloprotease inhibitor n=1 Tax=Pseudomonas sp. GGS8 TaxID=2817892 RepID=UPI00209F65EF|nr:AprI/Inh family metalloprotease inhibitor [Pseudomonas sp. GGS8]MCP1445619.1 hypothetical protein [Pseudomonas sp. GGS8]
MNQNALTCKTTAWLLATLMMFLGEVAMARSLKLADPSELAGNWQAILNTAQDSPESQALQDKPLNVCTIELKSDQTLGEGADCLGAWLNKPAKGWFPEPDGIAVTGEEGSKIVFFSRLHAGLYKSTLKSGLIITLMRAAQ